MWIKDHDGDGINLARCTELIADYDNDPAVWKLKAYSEWESEAYVVVMVGKQAEVIKARDEILDAICGVAVSPRKGKPEFPRSRAGSVVSEAAES